MKKEDKNELLHEEKKFIMSETDKRLAQLYPEAICSLEHGGDAWKLLIMARLSAQCTDARVNIVSEKLFEKYPTVYAMAAAEISELEETVRPCGLYRVKAKDIKNISSELIDRFGGKVPGDMESLLSLPGVGRKIANLIMGDVFGAGGVVTDTHCIRICGRLGMYPEEMKNPLTAERVLSEVIPKESQTDLCHRFVLFGRDICSARSPKCGECVLTDICRHAAVAEKGEVDG